MSIVHRSYRISIVVSFLLTSRIAFDLLRIGIMSLWVIKGGKVSYWVGKSNGWRVGFDNFFRRENNNSEGFPNIRKELRKKTEDKMKDLNILCSLRSNFVSFSFSLLFSLCSIFVFIFIYLILKTNTKNIRRKEYCLEFDLCALTRSRRS